MVQTLRTETADCLAPSTDHTFLCLQDMAIADKSGSDIWLTVVVNHKATTGNKALANWG